MGRTLLIGLSLFSTAAVVAPATAKACGGTFCDAGPQQMPVDQTGENILFVMEDGMVEAHVQIQYMGDPEEFAWVVPVMAVPEIAPGSDPLFQNLLTATVPTFFLDTRFEDCGSGGPEFGCAADFSDDSLAGEAGAGGATDGFSDDDPQVVESGVAGAFEYAVLEGGTIEGVTQWLDDNGYAQDDEAPDLLDSYLSKGFLFVAFKLRGGAGVDEIHPVVLRYEGDEPCVPIRLTRIAATDDMGVRAFFLGDSRVASSNFRNVELNPMAFTWDSPGANYNAVVTRAVDAPGSDGHGFVTEYAGSSNIVPNDNLALPSWDSSRFVEATPLQAIRELELQGLLGCAGDQCTAGHPLIAGLLESFIPRPPGIAFEEFYGCLECYEYDEVAWSGAEFAAALEERIFGPGEHALDVLMGHKYLTRLYTTISPHEMTEDPLFHENPDLEPFSNVYRATRVFTCAGPDYVEFDDGARMALDPASALPIEMSAALRVSEVPASGPAMELIEFSEEIDEVRGEWNAEQGLNADSEDGCNCRARKRGGDGLAWSVLLLSMGWLSRRRRSR